MAGTNAMSPRQTKGKFIEDFGGELSPSAPDIFQLLQQAGPTIPLQSRPSIIVDHNDAGSLLTPVHMYNSRQAQLSPTPTLVSEAAITPLRLPSPCGPMADEPKEWRLSRQYNCQGPFPTPMEPAVSRPHRDDRAIFGTGGWDEKLPDEHPTSCWLGEHGDDEFAYYKSDDEDLDSFKPSHRTTPGDTAASMPRNCSQDSPAIGPSSIPRGFRHRQKGIGLSKQGPLPEDESDGADSPIGAKLYRV